MRYNICLPFYVLYGILVIFLTMLKLSKLSDNFKSYLTKNRVLMYFALKFMLTRRRSHEIGEFAVKLEKFCTFRINGIFWAILTEKFRQNVHLFWNG